MAEEKGPLPFWTMEEANSRSGAFWNGCWGRGGGAVSVRLEAGDADDSFLQVWRSGLGEQDSRYVDVVGIARVISSYLIPATEGKHAAREQ